MNDEGLEVNQKDKYWGYQEWLTKYYQQYGDREIALEWQERLFVDVPSLENYQILQDFAREVGRWPEVRQRVIETLQQKKQWGVLIDIALSEREIDRALALLSKLESGIKSRFLVQVAEAAAKTRPVCAVELYQEIVERAISGRDRKSYRVAASYLLKVKGLYERLDRQSNWQEYCQGLRSRYVKLRALQDEMNKVGL